MELDDERSNAEGLHAEETRLLAMTAQLPEKIKKSVAVVEGALNQLKAQEERLMERLRQEEEKHAAEV